jgi:hypothetical protein
MGLATAGYATARAFTKGTSEKPAWKTTEFWLTAASVVLGALLSAEVFSQESMAAKILGGAVALLAALGFGVPRWIAAAKK